MSKLIKDSIIQIDSESWTDYQVVWCNIKGKKIMLQSKITEIYKDTGQARAVSIKCKEACGLCEYSKS